MLLSLWDLFKEFYFLFNGHRDISLCPFFVKANNCIIVSANRLQDDAICE